KELKPPTPEPAHDELWLISGDQVFGEVIKADRRTIELKGRFGKRTVSWGDVRSIRLRDESRPPRTTDGEHIRLGLRSAHGAEAGGLTGVVLGLDEKRLKLRHPALGDLVIDRPWLLRLSWTFHGRRIELDNGWHHLGPPGKLVADLQPPKAEGVTLVRKFELEK